MKEETKKTDNENTKSEAALREEKILEFWRENKTFEKSLSKKSPKGNYVFYDGPPFATGVPHYGHILGSTVKDVIGRYQTMQGFSVPRRWGWDCHGLPIENIVEKDLGISGKKAIEELGIDKFTEHARSKVLTYVNEWRKTVDRMGRWVDFDNSYKTMDNTFIESVWWALGELHKKDLLYEGVRVLAYCPRCETPIANSEIAMDNSYKDITDISVYVKFQLLPEVVPSEVEGESPSTGSGHDRTYLLAWTTTPWTLPGNTAIAINKDFVYVKIKAGDDVLIFAKETLQNVMKDKEYSVLSEIKGEDLIGKKYKPVFPYYENIDMPNKENIWKVWHADFVTIDMGTGIAHEAPAFGEDDMVLAQKNNIPFIRHVEPNGVFSKEVVDFAGIKVKPKEDHQSADVLIIKHLAHEGKLFAKEKIIHSYPHCYRCETPLLYYALPSWFVNINKVKSELLEKAKEMNWIPSHLKEGRFQHIMENAPDWTISRNRYWASPLPIWKSESGKIMFVNSLQDLKNKTKKSGNKYFVMRHGGTEANKSGIVSYSKQIDDNLTQEGKKQVGKTAEEFLDKKIDLIISSPFTRTKETTDILKNKLGLKDEQVVFDDRLQEVNAGDFDGKAWDEYHKYILGIGSEWFSHKIPNGESMKEVAKRTGAALYELENKYKDKNILIVTHGGPAWLLFVNAGLYMPESKPYKLPNSEVFVENFKKFDNAEARELPFVSLPHNADFEFDLHRPYIDAITLVGEKGEEYKRIPEVIDCWFESGSMPFAQDHFPFENPDWKEKNFPAGFVAEYIAQTRTWFYYTHAISAILFGHAPFANVVTTGTVLASDGNKMSKSKNNFPDPWILFDKYGVDALRFYLMSSTLMKGEDVNFSEKTVQEISSKIIGRLFNVVSFYELYRDEELENNDINASKSNNILDKWILSRLSQVVGEVTNGMETYDMNEASKPIENFVDDLSTWYLRRSRERIKSSSAQGYKRTLDGDNAKSTLYFVLKTLSKIIAPFTPFTAEDVWLKLRNKTDTESVHLVEWPNVEVLDSSSEVLEKMRDVRNIVSFGLEARQKAKIAVRQPLKKLRIKNYELGIEYMELIKDELNVKEVEENKNIESEVELDIEITPELKLEGNYRELVRALQDMRKKMGLTPSDVISIIFETNDVGNKLIKKFEEEMKKTVLISKIEFKENDGDPSTSSGQEIVKVDDLVFKVKIDKIKE